MTQSNSSRTDRNDGVNLVLLKIPHSVLLQLATGPALVALLAGKAIAEAIQAVSEASEEVFRGDRLPELKFPVEADSESK